jgi:cell division septum initiation protein DivIVA
MKEGFVRSLLLAFVLVCGLQAIVAAPVLAGTDRGRSAPRADPTRLWSEFPVKPREEALSPTKPMPAASAVRTRTAAPRAPDTPQSSFPLSLVSGVALMLAILAALLVAVSLGLRPVWATGVAWRSPRPHERASGVRWPRLRSRRLSEGRLAVSNLIQGLVHFGGTRHHGRSKKASTSEATRSATRVSGAQGSRLRSRRLSEGRLAVTNLMQGLLHFGGKRHDDQSETASTSETARLAARIDMFTHFSVPGQGRSETLNQFRDPGPQSSEGNAGNAPVETKRDGRTEVGQPEENYAQVGEQVAAVLVSTEQAVNQIRESALKEAERLRAETSDKAAATLSEAKLEAERRRRESEKLRADADTYSRGTRAAADRYLAETRLKIDEEAAQRRAEVDKQVRAIRRAAEQKAKDVEAEVLQRQRTLVQELERSEARVQQLLGIFRGMTTQLEGLVSAEPAGQSGAAEPEAPADEPLDEALKPWRLPSRSR